MTDPQEMISWLDRRIASAKTWLDQHGRFSKKPRPDHEIETKLDDVAKLEEIKAAYVRASAKREQAA